MSRSKRKWLRAGLDPKLRETHTLVRLEKPAEESLDVRLRWQKLYPATRKIGFWIQRFRVAKVARP